MDLFAILVTSSFCSCQAVKYRMYLLAANFGVASYLKMYFLFSTLKESHIHSTAATVYKTLSGYKCLGNFEIYENGLLSFYIIYGGNIFLNKSLFQIVFQRTQAQNITLKLPC